MTKERLNIEWPNGQKTFSEPGKAWLSVAREAGIVIPTGCLTGSCGACEIEVNGKVVRGNGIGRKINFPTANIEINEPKKLFGLNAI